MDASAEKRSAGSDDDGRATEGEATSSHHPACAEANAGGIPGVCICDKVEPLGVLDWARERLGNCRRIAATKSGADRAGWLEDASYWERIIAALRTASVPESARAGQAHRHPGGPKEGG